MKKKAKLFGRRVDVSNFNSGLPNEVESRFQLEDRIEVSTTRSQNQPILLEFEEEDLLAVEFTDNTEWIGHPEDIQEIYDENILQKRSGVQEDYIFETHITSQQNNRGIVKRALIKVFSVFKPKKNLKITMKTLGKAYDEKVQPNPGLYQLDAFFKRLPSKGLESTETHLLMLHGTLSTGVDAFGDLLGNNVWSKLVDQYGERMLTFEHYTLSESPLKNALAFLKSCPNECSFDILSHSRGGLIADILAKCDHKNKKTAIGFSENELLIVKENDKDSHKLMLDINKEISTKKISIKKVVRVASPASGTTILSRRVDHFFNLLLNAISLAFGIRNPLYGIIKSFLLELISQKEDPEILPGLNSMMPESLFQKMMNAADTTVNSDLYTISGNAEVGGINFDSLKVILANLFYWDANDLVVDTDRMVHGVKRMKGIYTYLSQNSNTNHFNYFKNSDTAEAILQALVATQEKPAILYNKQTYTEGQRGIFLDLFSLDGVNFEPKKITRDVVIILPGIMGSTLGVNGKDKWVQMRELNKGAIVNHLHIDKKVDASGVIEKFYKKLGDYLSSDFDIIAIPFDWRKSLSEAATILKDRLEELLDKYDFQVHIVAHSMGGLVARQCMMDHPNTWEKFSNKKKNKYVMLGTPWLGSYLIMEVLTGHSRRVKQLAAIDFKHDRKELLEIFWTYPGVWELLPIEKMGTRSFWDTKFWTKLDAKSNLRHMPDPNLNPKLLADFGLFRADVLKFLNKIDNDSKFFENIYYVCGKADETVFDYTFKNRFLSANKKLIYKATSEGDGSVTWKTGIPKELLGTSNLYYTRTSHGNLANEKYIFDGISDILKQGRTNKLLTQPPKNRSGEVITEVHAYSEPLINSKAVEEALFDLKKTNRPQAQEINVKIINGDLKIASYPVMVGHFYMDLILSAEKALDEYLNNRLSQRLDIGYYPGKIGESEVFFNLNTQPKGAIICGLGTTESLTPFLLSQTVKLAALKYAMFMRDNYTLSKAKRYANGISFILMGIGYGKLPIEDSLKGILLGISAANTYIKETGEGLQLIKDIEILNYYESIASQAYFSLSRMLNKDERLSFQLEKGVVRRAGAKKKQLFAVDTYNRWYNLHISCIYGKLTPTSTVEEVIGFKYYTSKGLARVEEKIIGIGMRKIQKLLEEASKNSHWDRSLSKTLFEMLIPNGFKNVFRNQGNIIIKHDRCAARIPWELLHDTASDDTPIAVTSGFLRQLLTNRAEYHPQVSLGNNSILVIGDPDYQSETLPQLLAAEAEAEWVSSQFYNHRYRPNTLINSSSTTIMKELYNRKYKILHFAGHGVYDPDKGDVGIAIGHGICIDAAMLNQMGYTPEFVFINCCYSGTMNIEDDIYSRERYELAANVGPQLIEMGVKAIIVAGWAVDDAAAKTFSKTFYENMFEGYDFGSSVQKARLSCYQQHPQTSTWGAYHCYGNQFYKFNNRQRSKTDDVEYVISSQVHIDLDNLLIAIRDRKHNKETTLSKLEKYREKAEAANLLDAVVLEKEALIYDELGEPDIALQKFLELFEYENGNFSIEALEQYCVIKTHKLNAKTLKNDLKEIEFLTLVGKNPNRLNIVANAYKFASMEAGSETAKIRYLTKSFKLYEMAYSASTNRYKEGYLDALTNMIFVGHILELHGKQKLLTRLEKSKAHIEVTDVESYLFKFYQELEDFDKSDLDVSVLIGMAETSYSLLLLKSEFKPEIELDIIAQFKHIFELMYSPRYIDIELRHIDFLLFYIKDKTIRKQLNQIRVEVEMLKN